MKIINELKAKLEEATDAKERVDIINQIVLNIKEGGDVNENIKMLDEAKFLAKKLNYKKGIAYCYLNRGIQIDILGKRQKANKLLKKSIKKLKILNDQKGLGMAHVSMGVCHWRRGELDLAINSLQESLKIQDISDLEHRGWSLFMLGNIYNDLGYYDLSVKYYLQSLKVFNSINYSRGSGRAMSGLSLVYINNNEIQKAKNLTRKALKIHSKYNYKIGISRCYNDLGIISRKEEKIKKAIEFFSKSLEIRKKLGTPLPIITSLIELGDSYQIIKNYSKSISFLTKALKIATKIDANAKLIKIHKLLSQTYELNNETQKALFHFKKCYGFQTKFLEENTQSKIANLENKFKAEQKKREAKLYKQKNEELKKINLILNKQKEEIQSQAKLLEQSNQEKELLLIEIHHRVKNNLQIILSLLNLQASKHENPIVLDAIYESSTRIKTMALIHQKLYQSERLDKIDFKEYTKQLTRYLISTYKINENRIKIIIEGIEIPLKIETAIPLGLIINELVTNALKYAFPDIQGEIHISFSYHLQSEFYELKVADNGIGLPKNINIEKLNSLGYKLVQGLVTQISGSLEFQNHNGSCFIIKFPEHKYETVN